MKRTCFFLLFLLAYFEVSGQLKTHSTDTINKKIFIGFLANLEYAKNKSLSPTETKVLNCRMQVIKKTKNPFVNFETGANFINHTDINVFGLPYETEILNYIGVPINYRIENKIFYISTGLIAELLIKENYYLHPNYNKKKINVGYNINCGIEKRISNKANLVMEIRYSSIKYTYGILNKYFRPTFVNYGLGVGVNYHL